MYIDPFSKGKYKTLYINNDLMSCAIKYKIIYINFHTSYESKERFHKVSQLYQDDFLGRIHTKNLKKK